MYYTKEYMRELAPLIRMPAEALEALEAHYEDLDPIEAEKIAKFWADPQLKRPAKAASIADISSREHGDILCVLIYMAASGYAHETYRKLGIPDRIFYDTFNCLAEKMETCMKFRGYWGYTSVTWPVLHTGLQIFRIGRLSYEMRTAEDDILVNGKVLMPTGTPHIYLHIADNDRLCGCEESIKEARAFFAEFYPEYKDAMFFTQTWLLDTRLSEILAPESNIMQFQKLFHIMELRDNVPGVMPRIFGEYKENPDDYVITSSLGRGIVKYLKEGKQLGLGVAYTKF